MIQLLLIIKFISYPTSNDSEQLEIKTLKTRKKYRKMKSEDSKVD